MQLRADSLWDLAVSLKDRAAYDSAVTVAEHASRLFLSIGDQTGVVRSGNTKGSALWKSGRYNEAEAHLDTVLERGLSNLGERNEHVALTYNELGITHFNLSQFESSQRLLEKAAQIRIDLFGEMHEAVAESYNNLGAVHLPLGEYSKTLNYFKKSLEIQEHLYGRLHSSTGMMYQNLGAVYRILGNYEESEKLLLQAIEIDIHALGEYHPDVALGYENLASLYHMVALYDKTEEIYNRVLEIRKNAQDLNLIDLARSYHNIGSNFNIKGRHLNAIEYIQKALRIRLSELGPTHESVASTLHALGTAYTYANRLDDALRVSTRALDIRKELFGLRHPDIANSLLSIGKIYKLQDSLDLAKKSFAEALSIQEQILNPNHPSLAASYYNLGKLYTSSGEFELAGVYLKKALPIQMNSLGEIHPDLARTKLGLGDLAVRQHRYEKALSYYDQSIAANLIGSQEDWNPDIFPLDQTLSTELLIESLIAKARTFHVLFQEKADKERLLESHRYYLISLDILDQYRRSFRSEASKLMISEESYDHFADAIAVSLALHRATDDPRYLDDAFKIAEKGKASTLLDAIHEADARRFAGLPDSLLAYEKDLRARLSFYDRNLLLEELKKDDADSAKINLWRDKTFVLHQNYDALLDSLERNYPDYYDLKYKSYTASIADVRSEVLQDNEALVAYFSGEDSLFIFAVTDEAVRITSKKRDSSLVRKVDLLREGIVLRNKDAFTHSARELYQYLLEPVAELIDSKENWVIVPEGVLNYIPFESLLTSSVQTSTDYVHYPFVLKEHSLRYAYSSTLDITQRNARKHDVLNHLPSKDFVAFAPVFSQGISTTSREAEPDREEQFERAAFSPEILDALSDSELQLSLDAFTDAAMDSKRKEEWGYLPQTRSEVESIASLFRHRYSFWDRWFGDRTRVYLEREASESVVKSQQLRSHRFVHFATHGLINEEVPELSGIVLAQDEAGEEDGVLHLGEVYNLSLDAELVVLSACDTGLGKLAKGEGLIGLSRGFMYAGARSLMASLWNVEDGSTRYLMEFFYEDLLAGKPKAQALREAKLALIDKHPVFAFPYYWAGFILIGGE